MQIVGCKVSYLLSIWTNYIGVCDVPFLGNVPVENACARRYFMVYERDNFIEYIQGASESVAGNAAANGPQPIKVGLQIFR